MFEIGKIYHRRTDLHDKFGGNPQSGISPCANYGIVFLFTSPEGRVHGYKDEWISDKVFQYCGEGQFGDMELNRGNLAIQKHLEKNRRLFLFKKVASGKYKYISEFEYLEHEIKDYDANDEKRRVILFKLQQI